MPSQTRKKPQFDKNQIVAEALKLLNETRLTGLTMRVLASRLGLSASSLYWYFPNKAALVSAMSERMFIHAIEATPDADNWRDWMRSLGRAVWDNLIDYPDSGLLIMTADLSEEQFNRNNSAIRQKLEKYEIDTEDGYRLLSGIQALITGWTTFAHSPYVDRLESVLNIKESAMDTLDAMVLGWPAR